MQNEHAIVQKVYDAKENINLADDLIRSYLPFISSEVSRFLNRYTNENDDEVSIAMLAFHEAINGYSKNRGSFLNYASMLIRSRLIDYTNSQKRFEGVISLDEEIKDGENETLYDRIPSKHTDALEEVRVQATKQEVLELTQVMNEFGVSLSDVADNSPKQDRTLEMCKKVIRYAYDNPEILEELLETKKLPMKQLIEGSKADRKTIERHRRYVLAMLLILTNGYEIIRGHLVNILREKGGLS